jgi:hypothetical protein
MQLQGDFFKREPKLRHAQLCMQRAGAHFQNFYNKIYYEHLTLNKIIHIV